jgi:autotransporter-associated beta strand protein
MKIKRLFLFPASIAAGTILVSPNLRAAAITWDAGGVNNNWSTVANWSDNAAAAGDDITFNSTGALASGITNTVDASISIASLTYNQESATLQHTTAIAAGQTLTVSGNFLLAGSTTAANPTNVTLTGATGTLTVGNGSNSTFQVGQTTPGATGTTTNSLDMSGLGTFNANLGASGVFRVGANNSNTTGAQVTVKLAAASTITTDVFGVGDRAGRGITQTVKLGSATNIINANTVAIGSTNGRGSGNLSFETGTGTLQLRAADGTSVVTTMNMVNNAFNHNGNHSAVVDFTGHSVDAKIGALTMARRTGTGSAGSTATLSFDTGTLEVTSVNMAVASNVGMTGGNTATINIGGGTATFGAITMSTNSGGGTTTGTLNFTGGTTTLNGNIVKGAGTSNIANLNLNGASAVLDMTGKNITSLTNITYTNGLLKNLGTVNTGITLAGTGSRVFDQATDISGQIQGAITGTGLGLTKQGAGTLVLSGTNSYDGATQVDGGFLVFRNSGAKSTGLVTAGAAGSIGFGVGAISGDYTSADVAALFSNTLSGFSLDNASSVGIDTTSGNFDQTTALTGARNLTKLGTNTLTLSQANTYTGVTTLSAGAINLGVAETVGVSGPLGNSAAANPGSIVFGGGTLQHSASNTHDYSGRFSTVANQAYSINTNSQNITWAANLISSGGTLTKGGAGTLTLTGNNTFTGGVTISTGELKITHANALGTGPKTINAQNAGYLALDGSAGNISLASNLSITTAGLSILNSAGNNVINGTVRTIAGNGTSTITSDGGSLNLAGNIDSGATGNRVLELSGTSTGANTVSGSISNGTATLAITKSGTGTWSITNGTNAYTGATNANAGTLVVNTTGSINTSSGVNINGGDFRYNASTNLSPTVTFNSGTISGTNWDGSLSGQTIGTGKTIAPGNSPGTATTGAQTWASGGSYLWEINNATGSAGADPGWDLLSGSSILDITATSGGTFNLLITSLTLSNTTGFATNFSDAGIYNWLIADFATITGFDATDFSINTSAFSNSFTGNFGVSLGGVGAVPGDSSQIFLTYTPVPEPSAALLGSLGLIAVLRRRRSC